MSDVRPLNDREDRPVSDEPEVYTHRSKRDRGERLSLKRDWVALLLPTLVVLLVSTLVQVGGYIWFAATLQSRVSNMEVRQKASEEILRALPSDYVSRAEQLRNEQDAKERREESQRRFDRMEGKIDLLLERRSR